MIADIRDLGYPSEDEATLAAIFDDTDAMLDPVEAASGGCDSEAESFASLGEWMGAYGLVVCAG